MEIEGTVTISIKDYEKMQKTIKKLENDNARLNNIIDMPVVRDVLHINIEE